MKRFSFVLALLVAASAFAGCLGGDEGGDDGPGAGDDPGTGNGGNQTGNGDNMILVGTDVPFPPFETKNLTTDEFEGFDMDVMREIGRRAGFTPQFEARAFDTLVPSVQNGELDAAISAMSITENRSKQVDFSIPYYEANQSVSFRAGEAGDYDSLESMKDQDLIIGAQTGTVGADLALQNFGQQNVRTFQDYPLAMQALERGDVNAVIMDTPAQVEYIRTKGGAEIAFEFSVDDVYGIAVQKGNSDLLNKINDALVAMFEDGTMDQLREKWGLEA